MIHIANLTDAQAVACAKQMHARGRIYLCNQIIAAVNAQACAQAQACRAPSPSPHRRTPMNYRLQEQIESFERIRDVARREGDLTKLISVQDTLNLLYYIRDGE